MKLFAVVASVAFAVSAVSAFAQSAEPVDPKRFEPLLPAAWQGVTRGKVQLDQSKQPKRSEASAHYKNGNVFEAKLAIADEGAYNAKMYKDYGADYLTKDVKNETQKSIKVAGKRALLTQTTATSWLVDTFVADRYLVKVACMKATEAQCIAAMEKFDFAAIEKLKP